MAPGKAPPSGKKPAGSGSKDKSSKDSAAKKGRSAKPGKDADGDEEMTVVVPPPRVANKSKTDADGDVEMVEEDSSKKDISDEPVGELQETVLAIHKNFELIERAVLLFDARFSLRALRSISTLRKSLTLQNLLDVMEQACPSKSGQKPTALSSVRAAVQNEDLMEVDDVSKPARKAQLAKKESNFLPEIDIYIGVLAQVWFYDHGQFEVGAKLSKKLCDKINSYNRRTLDSLSAKVYFYYSLFVEHMKPLPPSPQSPVITIRPTLLTALRTAVLRKDIDTQASIIVLLLRNYLLTSHVSQADLLVSHTQFPDNAVNNQVARFLFYLGRIRAIQLRYTEAHEHLMTATRKAPSSVCALGFSQAATKMLVVVELLMGDIPDRAIFRQSTMEQALQPYFRLVQAVRVGNLEEFEHVIMENAELFKRENTYTLIVRLRQNVIKTGIRMMSLSYSRISLRDICIRLHLKGEESAEYIVAKAIRDGVIEATLNREKGFMKSKEIGDVYATREPGEAFHERIRACLTLHDESVKAMRFPMNQHRLELKNAQEAREREREMAKEIQEGELDDSDIGGDFDGI